jgi:ABC-type amino acid transport/signal transduction systems, periplasmic component/domain
MLTSCASVQSADPSATTDGEPVKKSEALVKEIRAMLPEDIRTKGVITAATDPITPPYEFMNDSNDEIIGMDPDIGHAIGDVLGVEIKFSQVTFAGIIAAVKSGRYDMSLLSMYDKPERQKEIDFVNYFIDGTRLIVEKGNPLEIKDLDDLCGRTVSMLQGAVMLQTLEAHQPKCGAKPIDIALVPSTSDQLLQLKTKRAVATLANGVVTQYIIDKQGGGDVEVLTEKMFTKGLMGFGFKKDSTQLRDAVQAALNHIIDNGVYSKILAKWNVPASNAITEATINGGQ